MDANKLYSIMWGCVSVVLVVLIVSIFIYSAHVSTLHQQAVLKAADPARLACVYEASDNSTTIACLSAGRE